MISIKKWLWETCSGWSKTWKKSGRLETQVKTGFSASQIHFTFSVTIFYVINLLYYFNLLFFLNVKVKKSSRITTKFFGDERRAPWMNKIISEERESVSWFKLGTQRTYRTSETSIFLPVMLPQSDQVGLWPWYYQVPTAVGAPFIFNQKDTSSCILNRNENFLNLVEPNLIPNQGRTTGVISVLFSWFVWKHFIKIDSYVCPIYKTWIRWCSLFPEEGDYNSVKSGVYGGGDENRIWS